ncbi:MAG: amidohydrolase family protein, partial [Anaerolineae bacterium]
MSTTLIHNGTVIDGNGGAPITDGAVLIKDNSIRAVGRKADIPLPNEKITMIDAQGGTILPGMIDTHVHMMLEGVNLIQMAISPFSLRFFEVIERLQKTIDAGITTVRDAGGTDLGVKTAIDRGLIVGPRIQLSLTMLSATGGHGDGWMPSGIELTLFQEYPGMPRNICDGEADVRKKVRRVLSAGAGVIKLCSSGGAVSPTDHPYNVQFSVPEIKAAVEEADFHQGKKVMAHAHEPRGITNAINAGVHSIEHGVYMDDACIDLMIKKGTYLVPTLMAIVGGLEHAAVANSLPEYALAKARGQ